MRYLADTNVLLRWLEPGTALCTQAQTAVRTLRLQGETICITPQNLVEFWNGATRPVSANGLGPSPAQADGEACQIEALFQPRTHRPFIASGGAWWFRAECPACRCMTPA